MAVQNVTHSINVKTQKPFIEGRGPLMYKRQLIDPESWTYDINEETGEKNFYVHAGMLVSIIESRDIYMLIDPAKILDQNYSGWALMTGGGGNFIYDGGNASSVYINDQIMDAGSAIE